MASEYIGDNRREVFILRLWIKSSDPSAWRGQVQRAGSEEKLHFHDWEQLRGYLEQVIERSPTLDQSRTNLK